MSIYLVRFLGLRSLLPRTGEGPGMRAFLAFRAAFPSPAHGRRARDEGLSYLKPHPHLSFSPTLWASSVAWPCQCCRCGRRRREGTMRWLTMPILPPMVAVFELLSTTRCRFLYNLVPLFCCNHARQMPNIGCSNHYHVGWRYQRARLRGKNDIAIQCCVRRCWLSLLPHLRP